MRKFEGEGERGRSVSTCACASVHRCTRAHTLLNKQNEEIRPSTRLGPLLHDQN